MGTDQLGDKMSGGNVAYIAYCMAIDCRDIHGVALPMWHETPPEIKEAWERAAVAAIAWERDGVVTLTRPE